MSATGFRHREVLGLPLRELLSFLAQGEILFPAAPTLRHLPCLVTSLHHTVPRKTIWASTTTMSWEFVTDGLSGKLSPFDYAWGSATPHLARKLVFSKQKSGDVHVPRVRYLNVAHQRTDLLLYVDKV